MKIFWMVQHLVQYIVVKKSMLIYFLKTSRNKYCNQDFPCSDPEDNPKIQLKYKISILHTHDFYQGLTLYWKQTLLRWTEIRYLDSLWNKCNFTDVLKNVILLSFMIHELAIRQLFLSAGWQRLKTHRQNCQVLLCTTPS